jgi:hypothetical protein
MRVDWSNRTLEGKHIMEELGVDKWVILKWFESNEDSFGLQSYHSESETRLGKPRCRWNDNIKMNLIEIQRNGVEWSQVLVKGKKFWKTYVYIGGEY